MCIINIKRSKNEDSYFFETVTSQKIQDLLLELVPLHNERIKLCTIYTHAKNVIEQSKGNRNPIGIKKLQEIIDILEELFPKEPVKAFILSQYTNLKTQLFQIVANWTNNATFLEMQEEEEKQESSKTPMLAPIFEGILKVLAPEVDPSTAEELKLLDFKTCKLWFITKTLDREKLLSSYIGKNEKTKIVCKFTSKDGRMPVREPVINEATHKKMLAYYYKQQERHKKLMQNEESSYLTSMWANPMALKQQASGVTDIKY